MDQESKKQCGGSVWYDDSLEQNFIGVSSRSLRWLDRCIAAHSRRSEQSLFPIVQGGLDEKLREQSVKGRNFLLNLQSNSVGF